MSPGPRLGTIYLQIHFYQEVLTMVICASRAMLENPSVCATLAEIEAALKEETRAPFRRFANVMRPPSDAPGCSHALQVTARCVQAYCDYLGNDSSESMQDVVTNVGILANAIQDVPLLPFSASDMWRRISRAPAWGLLIGIPIEQMPRRVLEGLGAEFCWSWHRRWRFSESLATNLRVAIERGEDLELPTTTVAKQLASAIRHANTICLSKALQSVPLAQPERYIEEARQWFRNRVFFASDKAQQGVFHHRTQSRAQFLSSARSLRQRVESGDNLAMQMCDGALLALHPNLVGHTPLLNGALTDDWLIALDVDTGCAQFAVSLFAEGGATPPPQAVSGATAPSSTVFVTPLPAFLAEAHRTRQGENPGASTLGALLPVTAPLTSRTPTLEQHARIAPSFARFRNALGPFAVSAGIDRYVAAVLCKDPRLVPSGKFFYARVTREELWAAADALYAEMGWGPPVPLVSGLAAGSQVTPTPETVRAWFCWMCKQVELARPTSVHTTKEIIDFHNAYVMAIASLVSFVLALRERKKIPVTASIASKLGLALPIGDKRCGLVPGPRSIPLPQLMLELLAEFLDHVSAMAHLLAQAGIPADSALRKHFKQILDGEHVHLFTTIAKGRHKAIGTSVLEAWWPAEFGLHGNHGRHFLQNALRSQGVRSTSVDFYVRHMLRGIAPSSSASTKSLRQIADSLVPALDSLLANGGLTAIPGLSLA